MTTMTPSKSETFTRDALPLHDMLYRQALQLVHSAENAEDLVQETFLHAFHKFDTFKTGTNLKAWTGRILFNQFVNQYRRRRKEGYAIEISLIEPFLGDTDKATSEAERETPEQLMQDEQFLESLEGPVRRELEGLDDRFRKVLLLNTVGGESYAAIASKLDVPIGTVMSRLHRAKTTMRERLAESNVSIP
jgi:RNA polymerase sigma-70 factor (ECF subfamily)